MSEPSWEPLPLGAHLTTPRLGYWHHGIYAGDGHGIHHAGFKQLLHRGPVEEISLAEFLNGHELRVRAPAEPQFAPIVVVARARSRVGEDSYRVWSNNCEHFATWCSTGVARSGQADTWSGWIGKAARMIFVLCGRQRCAIGRLLRAVVGPRRFAGAA